MAALLLAAGLLAVSADDGAREVYGLGGGARAVAADDESREVYEELGAETFLALSPRDAEAQSALLSSLADAGWAPAVPDAQEKMGAWVSARSVGEGPARLPREVDGGGGGVRLLRRRNRAPGVWVPRPCVNEAAGYRRERLWVTNGYFNSRFVSRGGAGPPNARCAERCGHGVYDDRLPAPVLSRVLQILRPLIEAHDADSRAAKTVTVADAYNPTTADARAVALLSEPVIAMLAESLGLPDEQLELYNARVDLGVRSKSGCELHSDFHSSSKYVFTAIIYLSDWGSEFTGGETVFVHSMRAPGGESPPVAAEKMLLPMRAGEIVQPKLGRVVLFTGGAENLHCKMPSAAKDGGESPRLVVQLWVQCADGASPTTKREQAARQAQHEQSSDL